MNPPFQIRSAVESDVPVILHLIRQLALYEKLAHEVVATEEALRATLFGEVPGAEVLLAETEGRVVAFALFFHNYSTFLARPGLYLEDLFVLPEFRSKGVGQALLRKLAALALERGCGRFEWSVLDWNAPAIKVYEKLGARPMSDWTVYRLDGDRLNAMGASAGQSPSEGNKKA